jgi:regulator of nonsense transcripts 3
MPASTPLLDALKAEKSAQRDKEAIQRNHPHYKDAVQASKREEFKKKATATSTAAADSKKSSESTAPMGKRAAKRAAAAAAQKASAQAGSAAQPKSGNAPSEAKPPSSSPSKGKSARAGKHHPKPPSSTAPSQVALVSAATASSSPPPTEASAQVTRPHPRHPQHPRSLQRARTIPEEGPDRCSVSHLGTSRQPSAVPASPRAAAAADGNAERRGRGRRNPLRTILLGRRGMGEVGGGRRTMRCSGRAVALLQQVHSLASCPLLRFSSASRRSPLRAP